MFIDRFAVQSQAIVSSSVKNCSSIKSRFHHEEDNTIHTNENVDEAVQRFVGFIVILAL